MSTLHKFKAYFGMVPIEDYEDDYLDEPGPARRPARPRESYSDLDYVESPARSGYSARRDQFDDDVDAYEPPRRSARLEALPRPTSISRPPAPSQACAEPSVG